MLTILVSISNLKCIGLIFWLIISARLQKSLSPRSTNKIDLKSSKVDIILSPFKAYKIIRSFEFDKHYTNTGAFSNFKHKFIAFYYYEGDKFNSRSVVYNHKTFSIISSNSFL